MSLSYNILLFFFNTNLNKVSNQNDLLAKKVDDLENLLAQERISHTSKNFNNNLNTTKYSISSKHTSAGSANEDGSYEVFNINSSDFTSEENKRELEEKINKLDAKCETISRKLTEFQKKTEHNNCEINKINSSLENINELHLIFSQKMDKLAKLEKLVRESNCIVDGIKAENTLWREEWNQKIFSEAERFSSFKRQADKEIESIHASMNEFKYNFEEV